MSTQNERKGLVRENGFIATERNYVITFIYKMSFTIINFANKSLSRADFHLLTGIWVKTNNIIC